MKFCYHTREKTNCTEDCRICLKEEIDEMKANKCTDAEINQFEEEWNNRKEIYYRMTSKKEVV